MKLLTITTVILLSTLAFAQVNSVHSRYGAGTVIYGTTARSLTSGELGTANYDDDRINLFNPATYGSFNLTRADFGQVLEGSFVSNSKFNRYYGDSYFPGFNLGFPVSQKYGIGLVFGVNKYSDISYEASNVNSISSAGSLVPSSYTEHYYYDGGITKIFIGSSYRLPFGLNIGASADFFMGHYEYNADLEFYNTNVLDGGFVKERNYKGFGATIGLLSGNLNEFFGVKALDEIRLSAGYSLKSTLYGDYSNYSVNTYGFHDTTSKGDLETIIPSRFFFGMSLKFNPRTKIFADFLTQSWSDFYMTENVQTKLVNTFKASLGFEYNPQTKSQVFEQSLSYRMGLSYEKLPYTLSGENTYLMSAGIGISYPLSPANFVDIGVVYSFNTSSYADAIKDNTLKLVFGLSIGELWFFRTEY